MTHLKILWLWERLKVGEKGDEGGLDGWMALLTQWAWVWVNSGSWWQTGRPGVLQSMGSQRVGHDWATELNWTESCKWHSSVTFSLSALLMWLLWWSRRDPGGSELRRLLPSVSKDLRHLLQKLPRCWMLQTPEVWTWKWILHQLNFQMRPQASLTLCNP